MADASNGVQHDIASSAAGCVVGCVVGRAAAAREGGSQQDGSSLAFAITTLATSADGEQHAKIEPHARGVARTTSVADNRPRQRIASQRRITREV